MQLPSRARVVVRAIGSLAPLAVLLPGSAAGSEGYVRERLSVATSGAQGDMVSTIAHVSSDGRYVVFESRATNLVPADGNGASDVFLRDRWMGTTERISVDHATAGDADGDSRDPEVSDDGMRVVFRSEATDLVAGDTNGLSDVFLFDRTTQVAVCLSLDDAGGPSNGGSGAPTISRDGRYVAFESTATDLVSPASATSHLKVFLRDTLLGTTVLVSATSTGGEPNGPSGNPSVSDDGRYVSFWSSATNLLGPATNGFRKIYVKDLQTQAVVLISADGLGNEADEIAGQSILSADGRFVAFETLASNLLELSPDTNGLFDVYLHDRDSSGNGVFDELGDTAKIRVSRTPAGEPGNGESRDLDLSPDGRFVVFSSRATDLASRPDTNGTFDVLLHDRDPEQDGTLDTTYTTTDWSIPSCGGEGNGFSTGPTLSAGASVVVLYSAATNLVPQADVNGVQSDIYAGEASPPIAPLCAGDGTGSSCPCSNAGLPGRGCDNPQGTGGVQLCVQSFLPNGAGGGTVDLIGSGYPPASLPAVVAIRSPAAQSPAVVFGDGLRCLGVAGLVRVGSTFAISGVSGIPISHGAGAGTFHYQLWYRSNPAAFCNPEAFNLSGGLSITWP